MTTGKEPDSGRRDPASGDDPWLPVTGRENNGHTETASVIITHTSDSQSLLQPDVPARVAGRDLLDVVSRSRALRFRFALALERPLDLFRAAWAKEQEGGAAFLWSPVFFGLGALLYFQLPREPLSLAFPVLGLASALLAWKVGRGRQPFLFLAALAVLSAGASTAQWRTASIATRMIPQAMVADVKGRILRAEHRADGSARYTLTVAAPHGRITLRGVDNPPDVIRVTARKGSPKAQVGQMISGRARLAPSPGPSLPEAYDFAFQSWFSGIGASGFFLGAPKLEPTPENLVLGWQDHVAQLRGNITRIIRETLPGRSGGLAAALIVGERSGIDEETSEALRRSGLAHILAISGLHMGLVAMTVMFALRALLACFPAVALNYPVRKWAAFGALCAAALYLMISGANVSAQRAFIMVSIMLLAILLDRRALTMRNVCIAALLVLGLAPEAVLSPGFQMSFAAVAALIATYEMMSSATNRPESSFGNRLGASAARQRRLAYSGVLGRVRKFVVHDMGSLALTSLVAGLATALFAAFHFYRVAPFGLAANLLAMPLVSLCVMPFALIGMLAMPFGLEAVPLRLMSVFTEFVVDIAAMVAAWEPEGNTGLIPVSSLAAGTVALLVATLARSRLKLFSIPLAVLAALFAGQQSKGNIYILENGNQIGILAPNGTLALMRPNGDKFSTDMWRKALTPHMPPPGKTRKSKAEPPFICDSYGCSATVEGLVIVHLKSTARLHEDCRIADIIVTPFELPNACAGLQRNPPHAGGAGSYKGADGTNGTNGSTGSADTTSPATRTLPFVIDARSLQRYGAHRIDVHRTGSVPRSARVISNNNQPPGQNNSPDATWPEPPPISFTVHTAFSNTARPWSRHRAGNEPQSR